MSWKSVWELAQKRDNTKSGHGHLSDHGESVLYALAILEAQNVMSKFFVGTPYET